MMTRVVLAGFRIFFACLSNGIAADKKPNILLVIAADMGIDASPCYDVGALKPKMPNLENLCRTGLVFDNFYTNPMCSPTRARHKPWFLWLAHVAPHTPFHLPPKGLYSDRTLMGSEQDIRQNPLKYYFAELEALDKELGRLLKSMPKSVRDNTVIMFIGDNGSPNRLVQTPYERGRAKASVFDGGTHTPLIVGGNGILRKGEREDALINSTDIFATILELTRISQSAISSAEDSVSFAPLLTEKKEHKRKYVYVEHFGAPDSKAGARRAAQYGWAIRDQQYKYIKLESGEDYSFDIKSDIAENENLIAVLPHVAHELGAESDSLRSSSIKN